MPTIRDIAKVAGVSISTVSHVVNKTRYVSPELVERVEQAIASFGSSPNFIVKKKLAEQITAAQQFVALISTSGRDAAFEAYIEKELSQNHLTMVSLSCTNSIEKAACLEILRMPSCSGVVFWTENDTAPLDTDFASINLPRVITCLSEHSLQEDVVFSDVSAGTCQATRHLLHSGHEQIAFLGLDEVTALSVFQKTMDEFHVPRCDDMVYMGLHREQNLFAVLDTLFQQQLPPTAIFVANTDLIIPTLKYLEAHNIRCPEDISIVCLGDFEWSILYKPSITVISLAEPAIAKAAVERLTRQIRQHNYIPEEKVVKIPTKLRLRRSTIGIPRGPFGERSADPCSLHLTTTEKNAIIAGKYTAAVSFHFTGSSFDHLFMKGLQSVFHPLGISIIATTDAHFDPTLQGRQLESFSHLQPDIVIGIPTDDSLTTAPFQNLIGKSKLIFLGHVPQGFNPGDYISCIANNNREYGRYAAQGLSEKMHQNGLSNVAMLTKGGQFFTTNQRDTSAKQLFFERDGINLVEIAQFDAEQDVYKVTLDLMRRHPEINGLYVSWEGPAMEALRALQELGRNDVIISTCDLEYRSAMLFAQKGMIQCITAQKTFELGQAAAMAAAISLLDREVPSYIAVEPIKVTHANLLRVWKEIFKENAPPELCESLHKTASYNDSGLD